MLIMLTMLTLTGCMAPKPKNLQPKYVNYLKDKQISVQSKAWKRAEKEGWSPIHFVGTEHRELIDIRKNRPMVYETHNREAAISVNSSEIPELFPITNKKIKMGVWDAGIALLSHQELTNHVIQGESSSISGHGTHVTGTISAQGIMSQAKGMYPNANVISYNWGNDLSEMANEGCVNSSDTNKIQISNHSYGFSAGWNNMYSPPRWYGDLQYDHSEAFGLYEWYANKWDTIAHNAPYYLIFKSAGNDRLDSVPNAGSPFSYYDSGWIQKSYDPNIDPGHNSDAFGGYHTIPYMGNAKNIMTVGAVHDAVTNGERDINKGTMTTFSSWGPTDDWRIKPDVVANGSMLLSTSASGYDTYSYSSGTSMSTPSAAGVAGLLAEFYYQKFGQHILASLLKSLIIHDADDLGIKGPDFQFGWGLINASESLQTLLEQNIISDTINDNQTNTYTFISNKTNMSATLTWNDPEGPINNDPNNQSSSLINDLNMRIVHEAVPIGEWTIGEDQIGDTIYFPYMFRLNDYLNMQDNNERDNVEQIDITNGVPTKIYKLIVYCENIQGPQEYAVSLSGLQHAPKMSINLLNNNVQILANIIPGRQYSINTSHDLTNGWTPQTNFIATSSMFQYTSVITNYITFFRVEETR